VEHDSKHAEIAKVLEAIALGQRIDEAEALLLLKNGDLLELARAATILRNRHNDPHRVSFVIDRNVNYTNVCSTRCSFCAFYRPVGHPEAYVLDHDALRRKAEGTRELGGTGFLLQGGVNPDLPIRYFLEMLGFLHGELGLWIHGFSPIEIHAMAKNSGQSLEKTLQDLKAAGLGSLPGGGAEILVDCVRQRISPKKGRVSQWLEVMEAAHAVGLKTTATMMFGIGETFEERIQHLKVLRDQQDKALAKGGGSYTAFAAWPFQSGNTPWEGKLEKATAVEYLRTIAVARIYLDNFPHLQSSWVTMGHKTGQVALHYGCDDMGSLMIEEKVVRAAGTQHYINHDQMDRLIRQAGFEPWQRDHLYNPVPQ
jgi:cyclic dehypoxanthinyl futalosine synthase